MVLPAILVGRNPWPDDVATDRRAGRRRVPCRMGRPGRPRMPRTLSQGALLAPRGRVDSSHRSMPAIDASRRRRYSTKSRIADTHRTQEPQTLTAIDVAIRGTRSWGRRRLGRQRSQCALSFFSRFTAAFCHKRCPAPVLLRKPRCIARRIALAHQAQRFLIKRGLIEAHAINGAIA
jgi:hypothetical protein